MSVVARAWRRAKREYTNRCVPDRVVIRRHFQRELGYDPDLEHPRAFNEKIQWLKLNYRRPELRRLVDKYAVREFVKERVGKEYLNEVIAVWDRAEAVDEEALPNRFVIKATHGSGMNLICRDRDALDWPHIRWMLGRWLKIDYYVPTREWAYKNVPPRLTCEAFLDGGAPGGLVDYKFFCFHGQPKVIQVDLDRFGNHARAMCDLAWEVLPFTLHYRAPAKAPERPNNLTEMLEVASALSDGLPFCRVDLYSVEGRIVFGELTMYPENGTGIIRPAEWDHHLGDWLELPSPTA